MTSSPSATSGPAGTQREIGRALAAAAEAAHGSAARPPPSADPLVEPARRRWFAMHHPAQAGRFAGVADHFGLDPSDPGVTLDWLGTYELPAGCSVAFYPGAGTKDGHGLLSRNFDFPTATFTQIVGLPPLPGERPLAADPWVVELHPDDGYASVTVGIMDVMGAMDGINEAGLTVALLADNETPDPEPTGGPQVGLAEQQVVRYLLDTCATVDEAQQALLLAKHYYFFTPCHFVVADRTGAVVRLGALAPPQPRGDRRAGRRRRRAARVHQPPPAPVARPVRAARRQRADRHRRAHLPPVAQHHRRQRGRCGRRPRRPSGTSSRRCASPHRSQEARTFWHALYDVRRRLGRGLVLPARPCRLEPLLGADPVLPRPRVTVGRR